MILITGYPYVRKNYLKTFDTYPGKDKLVFLLPRKWTAKSGKVVFMPPEQANVITTEAFFTHSHYPIIGGLLKGWMPLFPWYAWRLKRKGVRMVFSCSEPMLFTTLYNAIWSRILGLKHVTGSWENIPFEKKFSGFNLWLKLTTVKAVMVFSDALIAGNLKGREIYRKLTSKPVPLIPLNGIDRALFTPGRPSVREFRGVDFSENLIFTFVGAIGIRKGIHHIVQAFYDMLSDYPHARLIITGSGEYEDQIIQQIEGLNIQSKVFRYPWVTHDEVKRILSISDVFMYPSMSYGGWEEQLGFAISEASLMELPVVSTRSGSIEEMAVDGQTALLVDEDSASALEKAMRTLADDPGLRHRLGKQGRAYVIQQFDYPVIAKKFADFFDSLV
jgi:glycosyltransferase involved in cell wall biosynthesis